MKALFIAVTLFAAVLPHVVPTADASVEILGLERSPARSEGIIGALVLLVWAMMGVSLLKGVRN